MYGACVWRAHRVYPPTARAPSSAVAGPHHRTPASARARARAALYKQATIGDCNIPRPGGFLNFEANAKWDAWNALKGVSKEDAMRQYAEAIDSQKAEYA